MQYGVREKISKSWSTVVVSASNFVYEPVAQFNYLFNVCVCLKAFFECTEMQKKLIMLLCRFLDKRFNSRLFKIYFFCVLLVLKDIALKYKLLSSHANFFVCKNISQQAQMAISSQFFNFLFF
jgi:hypothetical protein